MKCESKNRFWLYLAIIVLLILTCDTNERIRQLEDSHYYHRMTVEESEF